MAEEPEVVVKAAPIGVYHGEYKEPVPERGGLGYAWDKGIGAVQGAIDIAQSPAVVARDTAYDPDNQLAAQRVMEAAADAKRRLSGWKTQYGQAQEEGKVPADDSALGMVADSLPAAAAIYASGPLAPVTGGVIAHGVLGGSEWDKIRREPDESLKEADPKYAEYRDQGMSISAAKKQIYKDRNTPESVGLNVIPNMIAAGTLQHTLTGGFAKALGTDASNMAMRIIKRTTANAVAGGAGGALMVGGSEAGRQAAEIGEGLRDKYDWGAIGTAMVPTAQNLALISGVTGGIGAIREPARPPAGAPITKKILTAAEKAAGKTAEVVDNTGYTMPADQIGSDLLLVTGTELGRRPTPPLEPRATPAETARTGTPQVPSTEVTPPGRPVPSEVPSAAVSPKPSVAEPPPVRLPIPPTEQGAAPPPTSTGEVPTRPSPVPPSPVEPRPVGVEGADVSARPATEGRVTPVAAADEAAPVAATLPVEPARQPMTVEELRAKALDLSQSPDDGAVRRHLAAWQQETGTKLGATYGEIVKEAAAVRRTEVERVKTEKAAAVAEERAAKKQAVEDAKAARAEAAKAKAEPKYPTIAEQIQERVDTVRKAREAEGKPVAAAEPEPTIGEKVKEAVEAPKPVEEPKPTEVTPPSTPEAKAPITGAKAADAIAGAAAKKQERVDLAALQTEQLKTKRDKTDVATNQQYERREGQKSEREQAAIKVFGDKTAAIDELKPLHDRIDKALPSKAKEDLQTAQRHIQGMVDSYNSELRNRNLPTLGGKFPDVVSTRAGHGAHHNVMSTLNNLARVLRKNIDTDGSKAKAAALKGLELTRKVREGKVEEVEAARAKAADAESMRRKSRTFGDNIENIKDEDLGEGKIDPRYPGESVGDEHKYVSGKREVLNEAHVDDLSYSLHERYSDLGSVEKLNDREAAEVFRENGETIKEGKASDVLARYRPDDPVLRSIFDAIHDVVKDIPVQVWSRDQMEAFYAHAHPGRSGAPLAFYSTETGHLVFRNDTLTPVTIFHEAIHAATSRALKGSERLQALVGKLQDIVEDRYKGNLDVTAEEPFQRAVRGPGKDGEPGPRINPREFIAELFSRPELQALLKDIRLKPKEAAELKAMGYRADVGKNILKSLWDGFLKAIGFKARTPNAYKVAVDMLQDMFEREMKIRETDAAIGRPTGTIFNEHDQANLAAEDPVGGPGLVKAYRAGDYPAVANQLMNSAHLFSEPTLDKSIQFLKKYNEDLYGHEDFMIDPGNVTPLSNTEQVKGGVEKFLGDRFGESSKMADAGYQIDKRFATPLRHLVQGLRFTNDLGNNLDKGFRDAIEPMKQWWSKREHFAQEYMDKSGANKLIDDIATLKHAIKDRKLWNDFETLLVRESYTRQFADEESGVGRNAHINANNLRDYQSTQDHKANQALMNTIRDRDSSGRLIKMRNEIHEFEAADLENRKRAQASDMLTRMKIADPSDRTGMLALIKDVRNEAVKMTPEEKTAFDRIVGADHNSKQFKDYVENRKVIRSMLDQTDKNGPHVPFMRHGNHVVTASYHVTPDAGVKYHAIDPTAKVAQGYDFENLPDAQGFIKNVLSRKDIQITQTGGREVVYDTSTGELAKIYTVEKSDGTAKTFENEHDAERSMEKGDELKSREITPEDVKQRAEDNQPTDHFKIYHRVEFNPKEYVRFESERAANEYRNRINLDTHDPNFAIDVSNVETPRDIAQRGVASHASSEMKQWVNRIEASPAYQKMTVHEQADMSRELYAEAARVTMMTGRRSINLPREYVKGASTDILKNMIQSSGASARAIAGNVYNPRIQLAREAAQRYTDQFENQTGGEGRNHRARQDVLDEMDRRLHAPVRVDGSWAQGIKRALQVSMISHLADASFLVINAMEPWILGAAITASRHGWIGSYSELAKASALVDPLKMARMAGEEIYHAGWKGDYRPADYEGHLLQRVSGQKDAKGLGNLFRHMFGRGLVSRDTGMEVERIHDPSSNIVGRMTDRVDATFRGGNTGVETFNRATMGIANFRLEFRRAIKEGKTEAQAEAQAIKYAEDSIFKAAGDYGQWNNPRYFNNPFMKLGTQFKKYPLRNASVYADAIIQAVRGDKQAMKQVAYMLMTQGLAGGALGLPLAPFAGTVNAAYILGLTDNKWSDVEFALRKGMVDRGISPEMTDLALRGALRFTGADFHPRLTQNSMIFFGDPETRDPTKLAGVLGRTLLGSPGGWGANGIKGFQQIMEAASDYHAGAHESAYQKGMQGADNIIQIKALHNIVKAFHDMTAGPLGMPKGNETNTGQAIAQAIGFGPVQVARKQELKRTEQAAKKYESEHHSIWVNRWLNAPDTTQKSAIWGEIQKKYNPTVPPEQRIQYSDLFKAQTRKAKTEKRDDSKLGVPLSGRQKSFADIGKYFSTQ